MGVVKLASHLLTAWVAFLHPCFASYKALAHRPVSEQDLERWVKYWAVISILVGTEYLLEWLISWVPFYWEVKTLFILYLALPQTQGSTFIYDSYLAPYFARNEASIDAGIATAHKDILAFVQGRFQTLGNLGRIFIGQLQAAQVPGDGTGQQPAAGSPADVVSNLWRTYGASAIAGIVRSSAGQTPARGAPQDVASQGTAASNPAGQANTGTSSSANAAE